MKITNLNKVEKKRVTMAGAKDVFKQVPISKDDGSPMFSFRVFTVEGKGHTPYHAHPFEHLNYIIEGRGVLVSETGEECEIETGDFALISPNEKHQYKNTSGSDPLVMICAVPKEFE